MSKKVLNLEDNKTSLTGDFPTEILEKRLARMINISEF